MDNSEIFKTYLREELINHFDDISSDHQFGFGKGISV